MSGILKKSGQKAKDMAKAVAKGVAYEQKEYATVAKKQLGIEPISSAPQPSLVDEIITGKGVTTNVTPLEHENIHREERKRMQELQEELNKAHRQEMEKLVQWQKAQQELLAPPKEEEQKPVIEPTPKRKTGVLGGIAQKAKGGLEMMKGKK
ncbi:hypothetical protein A2962_04405 [Candidatus Woesebacteria bacterium RIFCSPLOWO2_01_FULL_39_61]|uniref:Uncharacterized protein n=1 Tax=Candidatus Woesebacteria bacterium RIFCSPHIGHO2_02_FULL_39_13 TaxID=1802505 RepID=A0A1F7Z5K9_9BACT|nr:MAG: hypothetical protein A2692_03530 [Candidatus Woesebacteria bacterium RIFCSPHIGHO2_01_FULL_39_95]OGM34892.1 MAG: hypothetical protein A3D01_00245 [Candidatus Woesebacteria bacterium RIFCSPHIGHO2_02_FULL_39_13]OGM38008.1 MAG: hypothetical protein A3E13_05400 [Candidatus Woesebacteria bacterium RIFCSPHIGHO2_12_FULL_40_20]OGM66624.1 MAG: hypothetical protein A2962_04405 [Candidatus Woesebacteria bacterium RIFCSPLOWO2_01_FULL_39_61]OGM73739.1 MAG: hypothetical protein A3H19_05095 [Candidatus